MKNDIADFLSKFDLDLRKSNYSRFIDQKVTPDVLSFVADCILNITSGNTTKTFSRKDIENSLYFKKNIVAIYSKPSPENPNTSREYDKFIGQQLRMLNYSHILASEKIGLTYHYTIENAEILQYISIKERNALNFLYEYILKVLKDSGLLIYFEEFKNTYENNLLTNDDLRKLRDKFEQFIHGNTKIEKDYEPRRMFPKILNVYANVNNLPGTKSGLLSQSIFGYYDLMYNNINFRDLNKLKSETRQDAVDKNKKIILESQIEQHKLYDTYRISKAIKFIKEKYSESEVHDRSGGKADHVHHIFSKSDFPQISAYLENLIKLTTYQHLSLAHPSGNTKIIDKDYQLTCLISKSISIENSLKNNEFFYSKESFIYVLNTGLEKNIEPILSFDEIRRELAIIYTN